MIGASFMTDVYQAFKGDNRIWWTDNDMRLSLEEAKNHFEIYISGKLLQKHMADGTLTGIDGNGKPYPVVSRDVAVRLNNWDNVRASVLTRAMVSGFGLGVSVTLLLTGLIQFFQRGHKKS
jgi:hypothetical protein